MNTAITVDMKDGIPTVMELDSYLGLFNTIEEPAEEEQVLEFLVWDYEQAFGGAA